MASKPMRSSKRNSRHAIEASDFLLGKQEFLNPFALGSWTPPVDLCQTEKQISVRIELPGVAPSDIELSFQGNSLRVQGIKREQEQSRKLLCFYCLERRYGKFDRRIPLTGVLNPRQSRAHLQNGILTVEIPKQKDRRGEVVKIQIERK